MKKLLISSSLLLLGIMSFATLNAQSLMAWLSAKSVSAAVDPSIAMSNGQVVLISVGLILGIIGFAALAARMEAKNRKQARTKKVIRRKIRTARTQAQAA